MATVFQPLNQRMEEIILGNTQSTVGGGMPGVFGRFIAHVEAYRVLLVAWKAEADELSPSSLEVNANVPLTTYPDGFKDCIAGEFGALKQRQRALQGWNWATLVAPFESGELAPDSACGDMQP